MKIPLSKTLVIFSVGLSAFPVIVIGVLVWMMNLDVREIVYSEFDKIGARTTRQIVDDTIRICKIIQRTQLDEDERAHGAIAARIGALGVPRLLEKKGKIRAASQMTPTETSDFNVPVMLFGDSPVKLKLASDGTIADASGKVRDTLDQLKRETGLDFCILQRIGTSGAMLRIASTATDPDGQPYVGTYIPATGGYDDGAIVRTLLARKTFSGISRTGSTSFIANYEPILDSYGDVVGAIGYGRPQSAIGFLLKYFENIRIGTMGSVWAVELVGRGESVVRVSRDGKRNGYIVEGDTFKKRREMTLEIINSAVAQGDKVAVREYKTELERNAGDVITAFAYFKPWNMVIGATVHNVDYAQGVEKIDESARGFVFLLLAVGVGILFAAGLATWIAGQRGVQMLRGLDYAVGKIKNGDITPARRKLSELALETMSENLAKLVSKVRNSGEKLAGNAATISDGAGKIDAMTQVRSETLEDILGTINSISKSVVLLNADAREAAKNIGTSLEIMSDGGNLLGRFGLGEAGGHQGQNRAHHRRNLHNQRRKRTHEYAFAQRVDRVGTRVGTVRRLRRGRRRNIEARRQNGGVGYERFENGIGNERVSRTGRRRYGKLRGENEDQFRYDKQTARQPRGGGGTDCGARPEVRIAGDGRCGAGGKRAGNRYVDGVAEDARGKNALEGGRAQKCDDLDFAHVGIARRQGAAARMPEGNRKTGPHLKLTSAVKLR